MIKLIIDGDPIVYRSGFAAEQTEIDIVYETEDGDLGQFKFTRTPTETALKRYKAWQEANPGHQLIEEVKSRKAEPVANCLQIVRNTVRSIIDETECKWPGETVVPHTVLSGPGNFRLDIAKQKPYKGNRDPSHMPVHYGAIRNYLIDTWGAQVVHNREADDEVSIRGWSGYRRKDLTVIATIDKDLDQVAGWHYDYMKKVFYEVSYTDACKAFWRQVLSGDPGDNVPGCWRMGVDRAQRIVDDQFAAGATEEDLWEAVLAEYDHSRVKIGCPYADVTNVEDIALETAQLVYMQQAPGELWMPPGTPFGRVKGDLDD